VADQQPRLDEQAERIVRECVRDVMLAVVLSPYRSADLLIVLYRNGRMVLELPNDVLFDSGQTAIKKDGQAALARVATVLKTIPGRRFQVAGNTDDVPIEKSRFASNWELSASRAVEVVRLLVKQGVAPGALSAAGYGEFDPVASNATPEGKARNRRIEITLQPNVEELVAVPGH